MKEEVKNIFYNFNELEEYQKKQSLKQTETSIEHIEKETKEVTPPKPQTQQKARILKRILHSAIKLIILWYNTLKGAACATHRNSHAKRKRFNRSPPKGFR